MKWKTLYSLGFGVSCDSAWQLVDNHSFCSRLNSAPIQRSGLHPSACQRKSFSHLIPLSYLQNYRDSSRSKLTVTNTRGLTKTLLACMQLYRASLARPKVLGFLAHQLSQSVMTLKIVLSFTGATRKIRFATQLRVFQAKFGP